MDPVTLAAVIASLSAAASTSSLEAILRQWRSEDLTNHKRAHKDTEDLVGRETLALQDALDTIEEDITTIRFYRRPIERRACWMDFGSFTGLGSA